MLSESGDSASEFITPAKTSSKQPTEGKRKLCKTQISSPLELLPVPAVMKVKGLQVLRLWGRAPWGIMAVGKINIQILVFLPFPINSRVESSAVIPVKCNFQVVSILTLILTGSRY